MVEVKRDAATRRGIWGWMLFDWAQQPFHTLIITFVFAPYFASAVASNAARGQELWGYAAGIGGLLIALSAPAFGAIADASGPRKPWVFGFEGQNPVLGSLNSYGRSGDPNMYGPKFNSTTTAVYNAAGNATANDIVGD